MMIMAFAAMKRAKSNISLSAQCVCDKPHLYIHWKKKLLKTSVAGIGIFRWGELDNSMVADTLGPRSASSSVATMLTK